jgi:hypothetical protein
VSKPAKSCSAPFQGRASTATPWRSSAAWTRASLAEMAGHVLHVTKQTRRIAARYRVTSTFFTQPEP